MTRAIGVLDENQNLVAVLEAGPAGDVVAVEGSLEEVVKVLQGEIDPQVATPHQALTGLLEKFNPHHGPDGRFTSGPAAGADKGGAPGGAASPKAKNPHRAVERNLKQLAQKKSQASGMGERYQAASGAYAQALRDVKHRELKDHERAALEHHDRHYGSPETRQAVEQKIKARAEAGQQVRAKAAKEPKPHAAAVEAGRADLAGQHKGVAAARERFAAADLRGVRKNSGVNPQGGAASVIDLKGGLRADLSHDPKTNTYGVALVDPSKPYGHPDAIRMDHKGLRRGEAIALLAPHYDLDPEAAKYFADRHDARRDHEMGHLPKSSGYMGEGERAAARWKLSNLPTAALQRMHGELKSKIAQAGDDKAAARPHLEHHQLVGGILQQRKVNRAAAKAAAAEHERRIQEARQKGDITPDSFRAMVEGHDHNFEYADDGAAYRAGRDVQQQINFARQVLGDEVAAPIWNDAIARKMPAEDHARYQWKPKPDKVKKSLDDSQYSEFITPAEWDEILKFNPNHGAGGKFSSAGGTGGAHAMDSPGSLPHPAAEAIRVELHANKQSRKSSQAIQAIPKSQNEGEHRATAHAIVNALPQTGYMAREARQQVIDALAGHDDAALSRAQKISRERHDALRGVQDREAHDMHEVHYEMLMEARGKKHDQAVKAGTHVPSELEARLLAARDAKKAKPAPQGLTPEHSASTASRLRDAIQDPVVQQSWRETHPDVLRNILEQERGGSSPESQFHHQMALHILQDHHRQELPNAGKLRKTDKRPGTTEAYFHPDGDGYLTPAHVRYLDRAHAAMTGRKGNGKPIAARPSDVQTRHLIRSAEQGMPPELAVATMPVRSEFGTYERKSHHGTSHISPAAEQGIEREFAAKRDAFLEKQGIQKSLTSELRPDSSVWLEHDTLKIDLTTIQKYDPKPIHAPNSGQFMAKPGARRSRWKVGPGGKVVASGNPRASKPNAKAPRDPRKDLDVGGAGWKGHIPRFGTIPYGVRESQAANAQGRKERVLAGQRGTLEGAPAAVPAGKKKKLKAAVEGAKVAQPAAPRVDPKGAPPEVKKPDAPPAPEATKPAGGMLHAAGQRLKDAIAAGKARVASALQAAHGAGVKAVEGAKEKLKGAFPEAAGDAKEFANDVKDAVGDAKAAYGKLKNHLQEAYHRIGRGMKINPKVGKYAGPAGNPNAGLHGKEDQHGVYMANPQGELWRKQGFAPPHRVLDAHGSPVQHVGRDNPLPEGVREAHDDGHKLYPQAKEHILNPVKDVPAPEVKEAPKQEAPKQEAKADAGPVRRPIGDLKIKNARKVGVASANSVMFVDVEDGRKGVYKPDSGIKLNYGYAPGAKAAGAEVAAHVVDKLLGFNLVPETGYTGGIGKKGPGIVQEKVDAKSVKEHYYANGTPNKDDLNRMNVLDIITGNRDRHGGNWLIGQDGKIAAIDNGLAFQDHHHDQAGGWPGAWYHFRVAGTGNALRQAGKEGHENWVPDAKLSPDIVQAVKKFSDNRESISKDLAKHLTPTQIRSMWDRVDFVLENAGSDIFSAGREQMRHFENFIRPRAGRQNTNFST